MLRSDFFQPLCDLIDDVVTIDVNDMDLSNKTIVLSLSEICLRAIKKMPLGITIIMYWDFRRINVCVLFLF